MQENIRGKDNLNSRSKKEPGTDRMYDSISITKNLKSGTTQGITRKINRSSLSKNNIPLRSSLSSNTGDLGEKHIPVEDQVVINQRKLSIDKHIKEKLPSNHTHSKFRNVETPDNSINSKIKKSGEYITKVERKFDAGRSSKRTNEQDKSARGFSKIVTDKKELNLKFKGGGPSTLANGNLPTYSHRNEDIKRSILTTRSYLKKAHTSKGTKINRTATESQKNDIDVHSQMEKTHVVKKPQPVIHAKPKLINNQPKTVRKEIQLVTSDTLKKGTSGRSSLRRDLHVDASSSRISNETVKKHVAREGRERTRTWTISSTSEDNDGNHANDRLAGCNNEGAFSSNNEENVLSDIGGGGGGHRVRVRQEKAMTAALLRYREDANGDSDLQQIAQTKKEHVERPNNKIKYQLGTVGDDMNSADNVTNAQDEYVYDDDFEEYESDFEDCSDDDGPSIKNLAYDDNDLSSMENELIKEDVDERVVVAEEEMTGKLENESAIKDYSVGEGKEEDEERMMDSGLYDSQRMRRRRGRPEEDDNLLGFALKLQGRVEADEGFDEREAASIRMAEEKNLDVEMKTAVAPASCVNCEVYFCKREPPTEEMLKTICGREKQVLQMIALDEISYSLFELPPVPYEAFVRACGAYLNVKQISVQTNEDMHSEGIQTDSIVECDAWTQKPPVFGSSGTAKQEASSYALDAASWKRLSRFMELTGEVVLIILEEQWTNFEVSRQESNLPTNVFSKFSIKLGQNVSSTMSWKSLTLSRAVRSVCFCKSRSNLLVCAHGPTLNGSEENREMSAKEEVKEFDLDDFSDSSLLSVWSVSEPSFPCCILSCHGNVSRTCFGRSFSEYEQLVFAGAENGSLSLWNMNDKSGSRRSMYVQGNHKQFQVMSPTFSTDGPGEKIHLGRIVGLEPVVESNFCTEESFSSVTDVANQVCSLDEWGKVVIWSVIRRRNVPALQTVGLIASMQICLGETKWLSIDSTEGNGIWNSLAVDRDWILAASDSGCIVCLPIDGDNRSSKLYLGPEDSFASAECVAANPQGLPFFMVGNSLGQVHLYGHASEKCIGLPWEVNTCLSLQHPPSPIVRIVWSPQRPFVFFSIDALSRMFVWDLSRSDIFPLSTIPPPNGARITSISLSSSKWNISAYMAVGMSTGEVVLHQLKEEFCCARDEEGSGGVEEGQFLNYINLL